MKKQYSSVVTLVFLALIIPAAVQGAPRSFPSWDKKFTSGRFVVLTQFGGAAVLDKETGLVWEQSPDPNERTWFESLTHCYQRTEGNRRGWRLPTIEELASLVDLNNTAGDPDLPPGHPFTNVQSAEYCSATTRADSTGQAGTWALTSASWALPVKLSATLPGAYAAARVLMGCSDLVIAKAQGN